MRASAETRMEEKMLNRLCGHSIKSSAAFAVSACISTTASALVIDSFGIGDPIDQTNGSATYQQVVPGVPGGLREIFMGEGHPVTTRFSLNSIQPGALVVDGVGNSSGLGAVRIQLKYGSFVAGGGALDLDLSGASAFEIDFDYHRHFGTGGNSWFMELILSSNASNYSSWGGGILDVLPISDTPFTLSVPLASFSGLDWQHVDGVFLQYGSNGGNQADSSLTEIRVAGTAMQEGGTVPEPASIMLVMAGLLGLTAMRRAK